MLTAVHIYNAKGEKLELPMSGVNYLGAPTNYLIQNIDGLGPVKADVATTSYATMDGGAYQGAKGNMRNVVLRLGFNPSYSSTDQIGALRRALYPFLAPKMAVKLHFLHSDFETVTLDGYVESFETPLFSAEPSIDISILCPDPYFSSLTKVSVNHTNTGVFTLQNPGNTPVGVTLIVDGITWQSTDSRLQLLRDQEFAGDNYFTRYTAPFYIAGAPLTMQIVTVKGSKTSEWMYQYQYTDLNTWVNHTPFDDGRKLGYTTSILGYTEGWIEALPGINEFYISFPPDAVGTPMVTISIIPKYVGL